MSKSPHLVCPLVCPLKDGFFLQDVLIVKSLEYDSRFGKQLLLVRLHKLLKANQKILLSLAILHSKLQKEHTSKTLQVLHPMFSCATYMQHDRTVLLDVSQKLIRVEKLSKNSSRFVHNIQPLGLRLDLGDVGRYGRATTRLFHVLQWHHGICVTETQKKTPAHRNLHQQI